MAGTVGVVAVGHPEELQRDKVSRNVNSQEPRHAAPSWQPTTFVRFERGLDTSMDTARIVTDAGPAYIKAMGNRQGPHPLACELVGTQLAAWFGLPTFEFAIIRIDARVDEIPFFHGGLAASGPAYTTKAVDGHWWGGKTDELSPLVNPQDVGRLVVFDTWIRNCDRHPPDLTTRQPNYDNVFLEDLTGVDRGKTRLIAMDHTHCFSWNGVLDAKIANIEYVKDDGLYGLFPGFRPLVRQDDVELAVGRLREVTQEMVHPMVESIPDEWDVEARVKNALEELVVRRAHFVADAILEPIATECWPDRLFDTG